MDRKIRVLHIAPQPPPIGGMVTYIQGLVNSDVFRTVDYRIVRMNLFNKEKYSGFTRKLINFVNAALLTGSFILKIITWNPDIVHIQSNSGFGYFEKSWIAFLAKFLGKKSILHFHGGNFRNFYYESSSVSQTIIRKCALINDRLLTGSPQMEKNWLEIGIPRERIKYLGNAVNMPKFHIKEPHCTVNILFLTRIVKAKGILELINAFLVLRMKYDSIRLRIVGAESLEKEEILSDLLESDTKGLIDYIGPVTDEQKHNEYLLADIFAFPTYVEDQSYAIMEAMSYGLPCVASDVGGIPSLITHLENGVLIKPKNVNSLIQGLEMLISDGQLRKCIGNNAMKTIEEGFTWEKRSPEIINCTLRIHS